jgi:ABC-type multidrug transport system fused ATPase/permease subunit
VKSTTPTPDILELLIRLWGHLAKRRQSQFWLLMGLMLVSTFTEVISLGAVLPFLGALIAPEKVFDQPYINSFVRSLGITSPEQLLLPITIVFIMAALVAGALRMLLLWANTRLAYASGADLSIEVYRRTLYQPYQVHLARNSSEVISSITNKVAIAVQVLSRILIFITSAVLMMAIMATLIVIHPRAALVAIAGCSIIYGVITWFLRHQLKRYSQIIAIEQVKVIKALQEGLGGIRDVLLDGAQPVFCDAYRRSDHPLRRVQGNILFLTSSPRFAMEALGIALIATWAYGLSHFEGITTALPMLGALALGAQRLLPALQQCYSCWNTIVGSQASLIDIIELLDQPLPAQAIQEEPSPLSFKESIRFDAVKFRYTEEGPWVLEGLDLTIPKGARVGFVGSTGSGKSTTLDLLMGLLFPTEGRFMVDGQPVIGSHVRAWQHTLAHVPQTIYLTDATMAENIAFGIPPDTIDLERVKQAAKQAQIADFIESQPGGFDAFVGERGIRISGGQRQRIGIARALYKCASVLVFDEATSALDNVTEGLVMDAIERLNPNLTILIIAHRITTVRHCDFIVELERGKVVAQGAYEQLLECSPSFRNIVKASV